MKLSFWILIVSGIPDFLSCIPEFKAQESGIHKQKFPRFPYMYPGYQRFFLACDWELRAADTCSAEGRWQPLSPRVPYMGRKICEQSQGDGTSSLTLISPLFSFAHTILMSLRQWKINFQPRIELNDNIDIHTRRCDFRKSWPTHIVSTVIHRSRFLVQGSITHLGSKEHNIGLLPITQQNCSRIIKWYRHRNSCKKFKISFFFVQYIGWAITIFC